MTLAWGAKVSADFRARVVAMAERLRLRDPSDLMAAMAFETGETFSPSIVNPTTGATGLIQFMPSTAADLGTSTEVLARLTAEEQLAVVERYLTPFAGRMKTTASLYMAILWPRAVDLPDSAVIFTSGQDAYLKNRGLDFNHDNAVTKAEAAAFVIAKLDRGLQPGNAVEMAAPIEEQSTPARPIDVARVTQGGPMGIAALLQIFGPILATMIPQVAKVLNPQPTEVAGRNLDLAQLILDTIVKATAAAAPPSAPPITNVQAAVEAMQGNKELQRTVQAAVVNEPAIMTLLEVGGGVAAARAQDIKVMESEKPFWKTSAVFWISTLLLPLVYWLVGSIVAGGIAEKLLEKYGDQVPAWAMVLLSLFGAGWTGEARSGAFNLVIGLILGGICGVYYGVSVTQQKQQAADAKVGP